jgi:hypothetical protein
MNKRFRRSFVGAAVVATGAANAAAPDFSSLTSAVDFSSVGTAVLAIAALLVVPLVVKKGARMVLSMIGR